MNDFPPPLRSVWRSLLWKEWHEHKWKLASLTALVVAVPTIIGFWGVDSYLLMAAMTVTACYCLLAGTFVGMSTAGSEAGRGTLPFLQSLPVPMWKPGTVKLLIALATVVLPLFALLVVFCVWWTFAWFGGTLSLYEPWELQVPGPWGIQNRLAGTTLSGVIGVSSLLLWMATAGMNRSDEIRSGAIGFLVVCFVWFVLATGLELAVRRELTSLKYGLEVLCAAAPGGAAFVGRDTRPLEHLGWWPHLFAALLGHTWLLNLYLRRFGKVVPGTSRRTDEASPQRAGGYQHLAPPMRSQLTAVAWKQMRETGPLALLAVLGVLVATAAVWMADFRSKTADELGNVLGGITMSVCFFVTLVTGIGVFLEDSKPRVEDFWRSRPVNHSLWFSVKFLVGALILALSFGLLMLLALWLTDGDLLRSENNPGAAVAFVILLFVLIYTLAMATFCALRQPLYAAVLTIGLLLGGMFLAQLAFDYFEISSGKAGWALLLFSQIAATTLAWQAVKRNWHIAAS